MSAPVVAETYPALARLLAWAEDRDDLDDLTVPEMLARMRSEDDTQAIRYRAFGASISDGWGY